MNTYEDRADAQREADEINKNLPERPQDARALLALIALALAFACAVAVAGCGESGVVESTQPAVSRAQPSAEQEGGSSASGKPSASSGSSGSASSGNTSGSSSRTSSSSPTSQHSHSWTPVTVHHDAVYEQVSVPDCTWRTEYVCGNCGHRSGSVAEANAHPVRGGACGSYYADSYRVQSGSHTENKLVKEAHDETVGYKCLIILG